MSRISDGTRWIRQYEKLRRYSKEILGCDITVQLTPLGPVKEVKKKPPTYCKQHGVDMKALGLDACPACED